MRTNRTVGIILALAVLNTVAGAQNLAYLKEFPSVDQVLKAETTGDPKQTAVLQLTALAELKELVKVLAGDRQYRDLTQDEGRLMQSYSTAFNNIATDSDKAWPGPQGKWRRFSLNINDHYYSYNDPRFGSDTLLFQKLLPPDIRTRLEQELTREGQVHEAFVKMQAEQDARVKAQAQADAASSPLNTAPLTEILMMKDSTPARRCLELGHSPMECTTKGFVGMIGMFGANLGQSRMKPGLSMSGIYKSRDGQVLDFNSESVSIGGCGKLVAAGHAYELRQKGGQIVFEVASAPQSFVLALGAEGNLRGPGTIAMDGKVVVGHTTVYVPASTDPAPYGTPAHNKEVEVYAPKTERCLIGSFIPTGSSVTIASAYQSATAIFSGQSSDQASRSAAKVAPPPGLRIGGEYAGPSGLKITFEIDDAILDCGEAHVARPYAVQARSDQILVSINNGAAPLFLRLQPDGSLAGEGTVDVAGRVVTGITNAGVTFAPKDARCAVGILASGF